LLIGCFNSFIFDYIARQKVGGTDLSMFIVKQLPVIPPERYSPMLRRLIIARVLELSYTAWNLAPFARDLGVTAPPFRWDAARRAVLRAELDGIFALLYRLERDEFARVLDTFPLVARHDQRDWGEARTRRMCLAAWDYYAPAAALQLFDACRRCDTALHGLLIDTLGDDIGRVPAHLREKQAAERIKMGRPPEATSVRDLLDGAGLLLIQQIITARRELFEPFADGYPLLPDRLQALRVLRNQLAHPGNNDGWLDDKVRRDGEAALAWLAPRLGIATTLAPAASWEPLEE